MDGWVFFSEQTNKSHQRRRHLTLWSLESVDKDLTDSSNGVTNWVTVIMWVIERGRQWGQGGERGVKRCRRNEGVRGRRCVCVRCGACSRQATSSNRLSQSDTWCPRANKGCVCLHIWSGLGKWCVSLCMCLYRMKAHGCPCALGTSKAHTHHV